MTTMSADSERKLLEGTRWPGPTSSARARRPARRPSFPASRPSISRSAGR